MRTPVVVCSLFALSVAAPSVGCQQPLRHDVTGEVIGADPAARHSPRLMLWHHDYRSEAATVVADSFARDDGAFAMKDVEWLAGNDWGFEFFVLFARQGDRVAMSYLRGPLTRDDVRRLSDGTTGITPPAPAPTSTAAAPAPATPVSGAWQPPAPPAPGSYADPGAPWLSTVGGVPGGRVLAPAAVFRVGLVFDEARADLRHEEELEAVLFPLGDSFDTSRLTLVDYDDRDFRPEPPAGTVFAQSAAPILDAKYFDALSKALMEHLYRTRTVTIFANKELGLYSRPGEDLGAFQARAQQAADERANQDAAKLRDKYASRIDKLRDQIQTAQQKAADARFAASQRSRQATASGVGELVGLLVGGRSSAKNLARMAVRGSGSSKDQRRAEVADQRANDKLTELAALEAELRTELEQIGEAARRRAQAIETLDVKLERDDIQLRASRLAWLPAG